MTNKKDNNNSHNIILIQYVESVVCKIIIDVFMQTKVLM